MSSILNPAKIAAPAGGRPPAAIEVTPDGVLAAALPALRSTPVYAFAPLPAGALVPALEGANLHQPNVVAESIRIALDEVAPRKRSVTLVLPDALIRVFVLDFDSLPAKPTEAIPVLRFRLRKMVAFDVEHAGVSYQVLSQNEAECRVLAAIVPSHILAEYEAAVRAAGYEPGVVLSSSLAGLESVDSMEAVLAANLSREGLTTVIANGQDLLLYRTLDLPEDPALRIAEIQSGIAVAAAYYEDKLQMRPRRLYCTGNTSAAELAAWLEDPELTVVEMVPQPETGALTSLRTVSTAAVDGALAVHSGALAGAR